MINKIKETISKYNLIDNKEKIVVGVSGGPDSLCLLHALHSLGYNLIVCHVNHGLRENANIDEEFVIKYCKNLNIKCYVKHVNLKDKNELNGMSTEEAGRKIRYEFFNEILIKEEASKIATAHNANDNAETVLLNIFRGSGVSGLKGIDAKSGNIIRPLIECTRNEIVEYCKFNNLSPRHDESNDDTKYTRNKVRLEVIPYIEKNINPNITNTILRLSQIVKEEEEFTDFEVQNAYDEVLIKDDNLKASDLRNGEHCISSDFRNGEHCSPQNKIVLLSLKKFNNLHIFLRKKVILKAIFEVLGNTKDIGKVHIDDIVKMCENNIGGKFLVPKKDVKVSIINHKICIEKLVDEGDA